MHCLPPRFFYILALICASIGVHAAAPFKQGDRVAFVGDSITHGGSYHTFIQSFYATRFPEKQVLCFNVGISGDTAHGGYQRASSEGHGIWENDVSTYNPTAATIMLGMNDVGGWQFSSSKTAEALAAQNDKQVEWYTHNYGQLLDNLEALNIERITLIKSSPYDQTMIDPDATENLYAYGQGKNDLILRTAKEVIDIEADKRGYPVVDFNSAMLAINAKQQAIDPAYSIIGQDRVHPGIDGHLVMAYTFLKSQNLERVVSATEIDAAKLAVLKNEYCDIRDLTKTGTSIRFSYDAQSLPYPTQAYQPVADLIPFESDFNQELLTLQNLSRGTYTLLIDNKNCGSFTHKQLQRGINLALLQDAPQVIQARQVHEISKQRAKVAFDIRTIVWSIGYLAKIKGHDANDFIANAAMIQRIEDGETPEGLWGTPSSYIKSNLQRYLKQAHQYDALLADLEALSKPLYKVAQPSVRIIEVKKTN